MVHSSFPMGECLAFDVFFLARLAFARHASLRRPWEGQMMKDRTEAASGTLGLGYRLWRNQEKFKPQVTARRSRYHCYLMLFIYIARCIQTKRPSFFGL